MTTQAEPISDPKWTSAECYPALSWKALDGYHGFAWMTLDSDCPHCGHLVALHSRSRGCVGCQLIER